MLALLSLLRAFSGRRNADDEALLHIARQCAQDHAALTIFDARSFIAAEGNKLRVRLSPVLWFPPFPFSRFLMLAYSILVYSSCVFFFFFFFPLCAHLFAKRALSRVRYIAM